MLRVNVGLSRKLSKDYNSTGYSINLEGEVTASVSDPEGVVEQVKEMFDLAEEALNVQVERSQSIDAIASHDAHSQEQRRSAADGNGNGRQATGQERRQEAPQSQGGNGHGQEAATNKQIQFLLNLGKQKRMSKRQIEGRVAEILGYECDIYQLTKRDACVVLDSLTAGNGRRS
jgi:hypothetical protein